MGHKLMLGKEAVFNITSLLKTSLLKMPHLNRTVPRLPRCFITYLLIDGKLFLNKEQGYAQN